jgi:hypothetical protein
VLIKGYYLSKDVWSLIAAFAYRVQQRDANTTICNTVLRTVIVGDKHGTTYSKGSVKTGFHLTA